MKQGIWNLFLDTFPFSISMKDWNVNLRFQEKNSLEVSPVSGFKWRVQWAYQGWNGLFGVPESQSAACTWLLRSGPALPQDTANSCFPVGGVKGKRTQRGGWWCFPISWATAVRGDESSSLSPVPAGSLLYSPVLLLSGALPVPALTSFVTCRAHRPDSLLGLLCVHQAALVTCRTNVLLLLFHFKAHTFLLRLSLPWALCSFS